MPPTASELTRESIAIVALVPVTALSGALDLVLTAARAIRRAV